MRAVSITLKIPDNTAYTALVALRKLGVDVDRVERSEVYFFADESDPASLVRHIEADETIFNPNKHRVRLLDEAIPRAGEVWIEAMGAPAPVVAWRLVAANGEPAAGATVDAAVERLLCNPAIERAVTRRTIGDRDNPRASE
ncbi:MAG TPA: hypothetical protein VKR05_03775 [Candidatus Cybelea sp.]|nr:hypothetical protein [Candidatus Cybelea sp.]